MEQFKEHIQLCVEQECIENAINNMNPSIPDKMKIHFRMYAEGILHQKTNANEEIVHPATPIGTNQMKLIDFLHSSLHTALAEYIERGGVFVEQGENRTDGDGSPTT